MISPCTAACHSDSCSQDAVGMTTAETSKEQREHHSIDWSELRRFVQASQGDVSNTQMTEMGAGDQATHHRRFSVDLGEVRGFIALRETRMSSKDECTALAVEPEEQEASHKDYIC